MTHGAQSPQEVLEEIGAGDVPQLMVFNKADRGEGAARLAERYEGSLAVSAHTGHHIDLLRATIGDRVRAMTELAELDSEALDWARNQTPQTAKALRLDAPFEINQGHIEQLAAGFVCGQPGQLVVPYLQVPG